MPKDRCTGCGRCCNPVVLPWTQAEVASMLPDIADAVIGPAGDRRWMLEDLIPISRKEGLRLADYLSQGGITFAQNPLTGEMDAGMMSVFYKCRNYDEETRRCMIYHQRPGACREYPWYGAPPDPMKALPPECGYLDEIHEGRSWSMRQALLPRVQT